MPERLTIDGKLLEANKAYYRRELQREKYKFYDKVKEADGFGYVLSPEAATVCSSIERFLGAYKTVKETIQSNGFIAIRSDLDARSSFLDMFALYSGAAEGLEQVKKISSEKRDLPKKHQIVFGIGSYTLIDDLITTLINGIRVGARNSHDLAALTNDYFDWLLKEIQREAKNEKYAAFINQISELHLQVNSLTINGFTYAVKKEGKELLFDVPEESIVGSTNKKLLAALKTGIENILCYDTKTKRNAVKELLGFPKTYMIFGEPGTGKSVTMAAALSYGQKLAKEIGKELAVEDIGNAFKSSFYSESAHNLRKIFEEIFKGNASYVLFSDDIDTVFFSRDELRNRPEDKAVLGELMKLLEGLVGVDYGNYLFVSTTNKPLILDNALLERLQEFQARVNGCETIDDYVSLFGIKLKGGMDIGAIQIKEHEWHEIGKRCLDYKFSGRAIRNICSYISGIVGNFEKPKRLYTLSPDEQASLIPSLARKVTAEDIIERLEHYKDLMV